MPKRPMPIVGITANIRTSETNPKIRLQSVGENYSNAVTQVAKAMPVFLPPLGDAMCVDTVLDTLQGLVLTGGASNIEPHHYGQEPAEPADDLRDPGRDALVLPLIRGAVARGLPILGICRGIQELNVAFGGTLHQRLHNLPDRVDHRRRRDLPWEESMAPRHTLTITPGGLLARFADGEEARVNSLHGQGLDVVAPGLQVEGTAEDGTVEAVSYPDAPGFVFAVQWHAEYRTTTHPLYQAIFEAFGAAVHEYASETQTELTEELA